MNEKARGRSHLQNLQTVLTKLGIDSPDNWFDVPPSKIVDMLYDVNQMIIIWKTHVTEHPDGLHIPKNEFRRLSGYTTRLYDRRRGIPSGGNAWHGLSIEYVDALIEEFSEWVIALKLDDDVSDAPR